MRPITQQEARWFGPLVPEVNESSPELSFKVFLGGQVTQNGRLKLIGHKLRKD